MAVYVVDRLFGAERIAQLLVAAGVVANLMNVQTARTNKTDAVNSVAAMLIESYLTACVSFLFVTHVLYDFNWMTSRSW